MSGAEPNEQLAVSGADEPRPRIVVTAGGEPSPAELAALVIALTPVRVAVSEDDVAPGGPSAWRRAALLEGVGGRPAVSHADVIGGRSGLGLGTVRR